MAVVDDEQDWARGVILLPLRTHLLEQGGCVALLAERRQHGGESDEREGRDVLACEGSQDGEAPLFGFTGLMDKLGVERRLLTAGENKGLLDPFSPLKPEHQAHAQGMLDQIHQQFIEVVRKNRGSRLHETPEMFSGLIWTGQKSVELGLADGFGSLEYVAREVIKTEEIVDYTQKENLAEKFARRFGAGAVSALLETMTRYSPAGLR